MDNVATPADQQTVKEGSMILTPPVDDKRPADWSTETSPLTVPERFREELGRENQKELNDRILILDHQPTHPDDGGRSLPEILPVTPIVPSEADAESFSGETRITKLLEKGRLSLSDYVREIGQSWQKSVEGILETCLLCAHAQDNLSKKESKELVKRLKNVGSGLSKSTISKLVSIGRDKRLYLPSVRECLPPNWTKIYLVTSMTNKELEDALADRDLLRKVRRKDIVRARGKRDGMFTSKRIALSIDRGIQFPAKATDDLVLEVDQALANLCERFGLTAFGSDDVPLNRTCIITADYPINPGSPLYPRDKGASLEQFLEQEAPTLG